MKYLVRRLPLLFALFTLLAVGCAEQRDPINQVQPYALDKAFFVGADFQSTQDDPEFWTQATLIDVGYGASQSGLFTSTYAQPMSRIKWQITEDILIGRLAYQRIDNSDGKGTGKATQDGVIVVVFPIEKHFDIVNAYNSTTGEQLNILQENATDRPWYERQHMRVDFSKNLNVDGYDFDTLSLLGIYGGIEYESLTYYVEDPTDPHAPFFDTEGGYFDITNKAFAKPGVVDLSHLGWGIDSFPACFLDNDFFGGSAPSGSCSPVELTVRHSFRKVVDNDYEPVHWDGYRFQSYGGFYVERSGYTRNYGMSDDLWHRFLARYPIWERSHYYANPADMTGQVACYTPQTTPFGTDANRDENDDGTADECATVGKGSQCDIFKQKCTLPYQDRTAKPIVWYYTNGSNPDFFTATAQATHDWDVALRTSVRVAQYAECKGIGGSDCATRFPMYMGQQDENQDAVTLALEVDDCRHGIAYAELNADEASCTGLADQIGASRGYSTGVISIAKMPEMIVLCHSPVEATDPAVCGDARLPGDISSTDCFEAQRNGDAELMATCGTALNVRRGDLRYHQVNAMTEPQTPSPWGIYTDAEDPLTGETVSASINVWTHVNDLWSQGIVDKLRYIHGELTTDEITDGEYVRDWATAAENAASHGVLPKLTREQVDDRMKRFTGQLPLNPQQMAQFQAADPEIFAQTKLLKEQVSDVRAAADISSTTSATYNARRNQAIGTEFEAGLMTRMMKQFYGIENLPLTESVMNMTSPLRGGNPTIQRDLEHLKELALANRGACIRHMAEAPLSIMGLGRVLQEKFGNFNPNDSKAVQQERAERMRSYVGRKAHYAVIVHEMGHSVGQRHNFVSSSDAWAYRPQYWQLRTKDGTVNTECQTLTSDGESCVGPRYFDPVTEEESDNLIWMFMHSSVMDYAGEFTQDMLGLGAYDFAAARMFYGQAVAVHADPSYNAGTPRGQGMLAKVDNFGGILGMQPMYGDQEIHYSRLQQHYDLISGCRVVNPDDYVPARWDSNKDGNWHPVLDGLIVKVNGQYTRCDQQKVDYVPWNRLRVPNAGETAGFYRGGVSVDSEGRTRVPYGFATDRWADLGNLSVYRHDNGADAYEIFNFMITMQEVDHIFTNYRRGRQGFSVRSAASRTLRRYNTKLRDGAKGLGLMRNIYQSFAGEVGYNFDQLWPSIAPLFFQENILASGMVFDHFARLAARPEAGEHFFQGTDPVLRSSRDTTANPGPTRVIIPNGATGYYNNVGVGGQPVENQLANDQGEFDADFTMNAGSYYSKMYTAMLFTESVDNFISSSRTDFTDARYRAVSLADLFPDGYRRFLANSLTGDDFIKGPRLAASLGGALLTDPSQFPTNGIGWTTWWGDTPETCFTNNGTTLCKTFPDNEAGLDPQVISNAVAIDPQLGWEQQKFFIAWTLLYLLENQQQDWLDMMRVWELGVDSDPGFQNRIEFHNPTGKIYIAKTFGTEVIFGKTVQRGIAARVLEYANELMNQAYDTTTVTINGATWYVPVMNSETGLPLVKWDSTIAGINSSGGIVNAGLPGCNATDNSDCTCTANRACMELEDYVAVPFYLREAVTAYGLGYPATKGIWD